MTKTPQPWQLFEQSLSELFGRLIATRLGWKVLQNRPQLTGAQFGKDIQLRFQVPSGQQYEWHIECKNHKEDNPVTKEEILPKLFDLWRSEHHIDVWCIATAHVEIGNALDEMIAALAAQLDLPFAITRLSPQNGDIKRLFACEPDIYKRIYPADAVPVLTVGEITSHIERFGEFLITASSELRVPRRSRWQLVGRHSTSLEADSDDLAASYLRGFETGGWESVAYGWAVLRRSTATVIHDEVAKSRPGFNYRWLIGSAGEGKSTLLRQVAWELADNPENMVLWAEGESDPVRLPSDWLDKVPGGLRVVLCVDGTAHLSGALALRTSGGKLKASRKTVFAILADRGISWRRGVAHRELARWTRPTDVIRIRPLETDEATALVEKLINRNLVMRERADKAIRRILDATTSDRTPGSSWLLPAMMEVTDRDERNFEQILESVVISLESDQNYDAARLLFAASLAQAANRELPADMGRILLQSDVVLRVAIDALESELREQGLAGRRRITSNSAALITPHRVVAEAYISIGVNSDAQRGLFRDVCRDLAAYESLDEFLDVPSAHFRVLDAIVRYLKDVLKAYEQAAILLEAWIEVDPERRNFLAMHRLGMCLQEWVSDLVARPTANPEVVKELIDDSRASFQLTLKTVERLTGAPTSCPPRMRQRLRPTERQAFHAWAVLEDIAGQQFEDESAYLQSAFLGFVSLGAVGRGGRAHERALSCSQLALVLLHLGQYQMAGNVVSALAEISPRNYLLPRQRKMLAKVGQTVPKGGSELLSKVGVYLVPVLAAPEVELRWPEDHGKRVRLLTTAIDGLCGWVSDSSDLCEVRRSIAMGEPA
jgi:tetratricopeptide (TPR) repeat protein